MPKYACGRCNYETSSKRNIDRHVNKINQCKGENQLKILVFDEQYLCNKCGKKYSSIDNMKKHQKNTCKLLIEEKQELERIELLKKDQKIKELELKLVQNSGIITNNIATNNITTNNNSINYITISLTPYNDPNMEGMQKYLEAALRKTFLSVPNLIESVHFNKEYPENHNICITNRRTKDAKVFDGKKWKTVNKEILINKIVDTYERELTNYAEEKNKTKFIKEYESAKKRGNGEKDLKEEVHNILYDNSEMINTKIKEVEKMIEDPKTKTNVASSESSSESSSEPPPLDDYIEFQKQMDDSD
jgi:DNA-directed RNA polymerase subunit RPC12/RpoP